jgi:hypothetical protein
MSVEGATKYAKCIADCPRVCKNKTSGISSYFYYGGKGRSKSRTRSRRGGFLGSLVNQAVVPFSILAAQQTYNKKRGGKSNRKAKGGKRSSRHH